MGNNLIKSGSHYKYSRANDTKKYSRVKKNVPWWDVNCSKVVKRRNKAFRQ